MKRAILFDFDGTLAYMQPSHRQLYEQAINEHAESTQPVPVNEISVQDAWLNWATDDGVEHLEYSNSKEDYTKLRRKIHIYRLEALSVQKNIEIIADRVVELESNANFYMLYEDVKETLNALSQENIQMGIVSNHLWNLNDITKHLGINKYFDCIISSAQIGYRKPHPKIYELALSKINAPSENVLFVGDNFENDYLGPKKIGLNAVLLNRNSAGHIDQSIESLREIGKQL
tara:strand:- start:3487 stop:4179 length:693 start_codon:yes stop_codon:yes gene_type:complete